MQLQLSMPDPIPEEWRSVSQFEGVYSVSSLGRVRREAAGTNTWAGRILKPNVTQDGYLRVPLYRSGIKQRYGIHQLVAAAFIGPCPDGCSVNHIDGVKMNNLPSNLEYCTPREQMEHASRVGLMAFGDRNPSRLYPERYPRGDAHYSRLHPERLARGDRSGSRLHIDRRPRGEAHGSKTHPERVARGERHGSKTHPERIPRGERSGPTLHPERMPRGEAHGMARLTEADVREIRALAATGMATRVIARRFNVSPPTIRRILQGKTWAHVI